jgi:SM-20-related protein
VVDPAFLARFGLYVEGGVFDARFCARLGADMRSAQNVQATMRRAGDPATQVVDEEQRRTKCALVPESTESEVDQQLRGMKPRLERHFSIALQGCRPAQFLIYRPGDFFAAHTDSGAETATTPAALRRLVSVVIFVNGETDGGDQPPYEGGALTFYGLMAAAPQLGLALTPKQGLLVAFRSELIHAVTPVTRGERCTIVSFFH